MSTSHSQPALKYSEVLKQETQSCLYNSEVQTLNSETCHITKVFGIRTSAYLQLMGSRYGLKLFSNLNTAQTPQMRYSEVLKYNLIVKEPPPEPPLDHWTLHLYLVNYKSAQDVINAVVAPSLRRSLAVTLTVYCCPLQVSSG